MQLSKRRQGRPGPGQVVLALGALATGLFAATAGQAQPAADGSPQPADPSYADSGSSDVGPSRMDTAVLFYQEAGGRVRAIEPATTITLHSSDDGILTLGFVSDTLTGASPNGAVPSDKTQTFVTPLKVSGSTTTVTNASGGSTVIQLPPTPGQIAAASFGRQYTTAPGKLPVDPGFHDQRFAGNIGWSQPVGWDTKASLGAGYSSEHDYRAITGNAGLSRDFNAHNTTASLSVNYEFDTSSPYGGTPTPLTVMSAQMKGPDRNRHVVDAVAGLTQVMTRNWLVQLNYSYGLSSGYQNDPYRILSVVDSVTGEPTSYLYENRPNSRRRQSVYLDNKVDVGRNIFDVSFRYFTDSWGIHSETADASDRISLTSAIYLQPHVRWYRQTAANFFRYYLVAGQPLAQYASSDIRLGKFTGLTGGLTLGVKVTDSGEVYLRGEYYRQTGVGHPPNAIGQLAGQNLFGGVKATSVMVGYSFGF